MTKLHDSISSCPDTGARKFPQPNRQTDDARSLCVARNLNPRLTRHGQDFMRQSVTGSLLLIVALSATPSAHADVVTDWNTAALNAIRAAKTPPPRASRALAILHASIYDAVNGIDRTHETYLVQSAVPRSALKEAAASAAAHRVMVALFPTHVEALDALHAATLAAIRDTPHKRSGVAWGEAVAGRILLSRAADGSDAPLSAPSGSGPGAWVATPPGFTAYVLPQWGFVAPFAMPTSASFRPFGPPTLDSAQYATDFNEVKALGAAVGSARNADQTVIALFWADGAGKETPPGHWNSIAQDVAAKRGNTVDQNARLLALLNIAMADAAICAWDAKYIYDFWRPVTAIRNADSDGNPATVADSTWTSFIGTPPFPDYVSGHSAFSGAAATVLAMYYGTDSISFGTGSDSLPGVTRQFASFSAAANEAAVSRLYGGIHFRSANDDGLAGGIAIGEWAITHVMRPKGNRSRE
jgi:membrane-associated phospholipid phosphatase